MTLIGLIAEFNPLHWGHIYFLDQIKEKFDNPLIVVCLSSNFVQRGEPAILDKWQRASLALNAGANLVVELPFVFACQSAEIFARGAISILGKFPLDYLAFGAEDNIRDLVRVKKSLDTASDNENFNMTLKTELKKGQSFIKARNIALKSQDILSDKDLDLLNKSNNILAIEYLRAIDYFKLDLSPYAIKRSFVGHQSQSPQGQYASATYIRNNLGPKLKAYMPKDSYQILKNRKKIDQNILYGLIQYKLTFTNMLSKVTDYEEGLENRLKKHLASNKNLDGLARACSSQRMTTSRIKRALINSLVETDKRAVDKFYQANYIRILGSDQKGFKILKNLAHPKIIKFKESGSIDQITTDLSQIEERATNLYSILNGDILDRDYYKGLEIKKS